MARLPTLILALLVLHFVLGALCLAVARGDNRMISVRYWGWGMVAYAIGLTMTLLGPLITGPVALTLGNIIIGYAPIPFIQGVLCNMGHTRHRLPPRWLAAALAVTALILLYGNSLGQETAMINLVTPTPMAIGLFLYGGAILVRSPVPAARNASRLLGGVLFTYVAVLVSRLATLWALGAASDLDLRRLIIDLFAIVQILCSVIGMLCLFWIEVLKMEETLKSMAFGDLLTGLPNRRATMMRFDEMAAAARRGRQSFTMLVFDIDFFKRVNDTYGHQTGDLVLKHVASVMGRIKRQEDLLGRVGGEEFVLLLANIGLDDARVIAERMREMIADSFLKDQGQRISVTISGGLALFPEDGESWDELFVQADQRLYLAKNEGRNRIIAAS